MRWCRRLSGRDIRRTGYNSLMHADAFTPAAALKHYNRVRCFMQIP